MLRSPLLTVLAAALIATGCASVVPPSQLGARATLTQATPAAADAGLTQGTPASHWWRALNDPALDTLVQDAMARNHDVQAALAGVRGARALLEASQREAWPQGRLEGQAQAQRPSTAEVDPYGQGLPRPPSTKMLTLGQGLSWELDLFGRVGTAAGVAARRADAARADWQGAVALLQAEVVRQYTGLRQQQAVRHSLDKELHAHQTRSQQLQARVDAGLADRRELWNAQAEQARAKAERAQANEALERHLGALAVLTGRSPTDRSAWADALLGNASWSAPRALPAFPALAQPVDLLARRPDVARADAELRAAMGEQVLATRAHWPRLTLNLSAALNAPFGRLGDAGALRYAAGPALSWDWLDMGRIEARAAAARAGQEAAWHGFEQTVLRALQDSEAAARQWVAATAAFEAASRAEALAAQSLEIGRAHV